MADPTHGYVSRGGLKLEAALDAFDLDVSGFRCADLGCSTGGFVDCLRQRGADRVFAIDTAYGELAWKLRRDDRVVVMERTNALHAPPPDDAAGRCDLVTIDLGWTKQDRALPAALPWLAPVGKVITLVKPHYESGRHRLDDDGEARRIAEACLEALAPRGWDSRGLIASPIRGGKGKNLEFLALLSHEAA